MKIAVKMGVDKHQQLTNSLVDADQVVNAGLSMSNITKTAEWSPSTKKNAAVNVDQLKTAGWSTSTEKNKAVDVDHPPDCCFFGRRHPALFITPNGACHSESKLKKPLNKVITKRLFNSRLAEQLIVLLKWSL